MTRATQIRLLYETPPGERISRADQLGLRLIKGGTAWTYCHIENMAIVQLAFEHWDSVSSGLVARYIKSERIIAHHLLEWGVRSGYLAPGGRGYVFIRSSYEEVQIQATRIVAPQEPNLQEALPKAAKDKAERAQEPAITVKAKRKARSTA